MLKNLKKCRQTLDLTQTELGKVFNVSKTTVAGWENGFDYMPLSKIIKFCNKYKFTIDYVTGLTNKNNHFEPLPILSKKEMGIKIRKLRKSLGLTQKQLADKCGITQTTLSNYENGKNLITAVTLYTICKTYKISMDKFLSM